MLTKLLVLIFITSAFSQELTMYKVIRGQTQPPNFIYHHYDINVPQGFNLYAYVKSYSPDSINIQVYLKHGSRPTKEDHDQRILPFSLSPVVPNKREGKTYLGFINFRTVEKHDFDVYLFFAKTEPAEERISKVVNFDQKAYHVFRDSKRFGIREFDLKLQCNKDATFFVSNSTTLPFELRGVKHPIKGGDNYDFRFNQTNYFQVSILGDKGTSCRFFYIPYLIFIDSSVAHSRTSEKDMDYFMTYIKPNDKEFSFLISKGGKELGFYVNAGRDPKKLEFPTAENHQFKSKKITSGDGFWGSSLSGIKSEQFAVFGVYGGSAKQHYIFSPNLYYYRLGFGDPVLFKIKNSKPVTFRLTVSGFGPFWMHFYASFSKKSKVILKMTTNGVTTTLAEDKNGLNVRARNLVRGQMYEFTFEGKKNDISLISDGYSPEKLERIK
eukprot:gene12870-7293_t